MAENSKSWCQLSALICHKLRTAVQLCDHSPVIDPVNNKSVSRPSHGATMQVCTSGILKIWRVETQPCAWDKNNSNDNSNNNMPKPQAGINARFWRKPETQEWLIGLMEELTEEWGWGGRTFSSGYNQQGGHCHIHLTYQCWKPSRGKTAPPSGV